MPDLSSYEPRVLSADDQPLFQEAVVSAREGAARGAYILIWISGAESLKRKFREASPRDPIAARIKAKIAQDESRHKSVDMLILDKAKEYGFIDDAAHQRLEYVYKMRCVYGHPYEAAPTDQELTNAAQVVVDEILSKPTLLKTAFVDSLVGSLYSDINYLEPSEDRVKEFASEVSTKIAPDAFEYLLMQYTQKLEATADDATMLDITKRGKWFLGEFLKQVGAGFLNEQEWHAFVTAYPKTSNIVLFTSNQVYTSVGRRAQESLISWIINNARLRPHALKKLERLLENNQLSIAQVARFKAVDFASQKAAGLKIKTLFDNLIVELKAHDWYRQNPAMEVVANARPTEIEELGTAEQEILGRNVAQSADGSSGSAITYLTRLQTDSSDLPESFIYGIVVECFFNESNTFRLKERGIDLVTPILIRYPTITQKLIDIMPTSTTTQWTMENTYDTVLAKLRQHTELAALVTIMEEHKDRLIFHPE
jgi:hypothetical protein